MPEKPWEQDRVDLNDGVTYLCLRELRSEYDRLNADFLSRRLQPAVLKLSLNVGYYGQWSPETRTISFSLRHVLQDKWTEVRETLRHEMAHQYVDEILCVRDETPHGKAWKRACHLLGFSPQARQSSPLQESSNQDAEHSFEPVLRRIRKLLALAENNCNEHEVKAALTQARAMMLRYNIDLGEVGDEQRDFEVQWLGEPKIRIEGHLYRIASLLNDHFFVRAIWVPTFIQQRARYGSQLEVCGERANVEMAAYIHDSLLRHLKILWEQYSETQGIRGVAARNAYWQGLLAGFRWQLQEHQAQAEQQGLVWVGDRRLDQFFRRRVPHIRTSHLTSHGDSSIRRDGVEAGMNLKIARPIESSGSSQKGLLGASSEKDG